MSNSNFKKNSDLRKIIFYKAIISAFRKTEKTDELLKSFKKEAEKTEFEKIRCPFCQWQPNSSSRWFCADCDAPEYFYGGCNTSWNTFETRGKCPTCAHLWRWTSCLRCGQWAKHDDWYEKKSD